MAFETAMKHGAAAAGGNVAAVLGPTNTGKTHLAIERMLAHQSGVIGLPLRLLAREVYNKVAERVGADAVALITGEEKIKPQGARYHVCTVEAMPHDIDAAFLAIDEVQLAADFDRGHIFTERLLNSRGRHETLLLGASTIRPLIETLLPAANILSRPRLSELRYTGQTKLTRLPRRAAIVAFSADEVYAIAELIRRQRGGTAVVLGALSPRTRNAQVSLYQSGEVDYLVATDAIGMGLNLDIDHVAFAANRKFDGHQYRTLSPAEIGQIAGRAGRHVQNGTFGVTGRVEPFEQDLVERLETHNFEPLKMLQWRNTQLDFSSLAALKDSLSRTPGHPVLTRAPLAVDELALDVLARDGDISAMAANREAVTQLWEACQIPDYRKIAPANHAGLAGEIFRFLREQGKIPDDWFARQVAFADRTDGDIDTLSNRIAHIRTWTYAANRPDWLEHPAEWQDATRQIEDRLSDALHERLAARFIDRRTSVLLRRLRENTDLELDIVDGDVRVEGQHVGHLQGFHFAPDNAAGGPHGKALRAAALKGLASEYARRASQLAEAGDDRISLDGQGAILWQGELIAELVRSDAPLRPAVRLRADEQLQPADKARIQERLERWLEQHVTRVLAPLARLERDESLSGLARGLAFQLVENFGLLERRGVAGDVKNLEQNARASLRRHGVRFGAHTLHIPDLLKPAAANLVRLLWALRHGGLSQANLDKLPQISARGLMSVPIDPAVPRGYYRAIGYQLCGRRAVRADMLERLADTIRPLVAWKGLPGGAPAPEGALDGARFYITPAMMSLVGCSGDDFADILRAIGFRLERKAISPQASHNAQTGEPEAAPEKDGSEQHIAPQDPAQPDASAQPEQVSDGPGAPPESEGGQAAPDMAAPGMAAPDMAASGMAAEGDGGAMAVPGPEPIGGAEQKTAEPAVPAPPVAPLTVDIWRVQGPEQHARRRERGRPALEKQQADAGEKPAQGRPRRRGKKPFKDKDGASHGAGDRQAAHPGQENGRKNNRKDAGKDARKDGGKAGGKHDNRPRRPERQPDPDSPFAALAELKRAMQASARRQG